MKLNKKFKKKWVSELKSGKHEQNADGRMTNGDKVCVLGLAAKIKFGNPERGWDMLRGFSSVEWELVALNDSGVPFEVLAGVIDEWL